MRLALEVIFDGVQGAGDIGTVKTMSASPDRSSKDGILASKLETGVVPGTAALRVADAVTVTYIPDKAKQEATLLLEWEGGAPGDMVADGVIATVLQVCVWLLHHCLVDHPGPPWLPFTAPWD